MAAEDLISFEDLRARVAELEETRTVAQWGLRAIEHRQERIAQQEQDKHALLERCYTGMLPGASDVLDSAERHRVYKILRVEAAIDADGSLEVSGDVMSVGEMETSSV